MIQMIKLVDKDIKIVVITIFHMFKKVEENVSNKEDTKKSKLNF